MSQPFVAEIRIFPFNFAPTGWALCDGQIMSISQNTALFSLLGTTYGGDGKSTFALPNLQGSVPLHIGSSQPGPGLSLHDLGEQSGTDSITLMDSEMPAHTHSLMASSSPATDYVPDPTRVLARPVGGTDYAPAQHLVQLDPMVLSPTGSTFPHNNLQPYLVLTFCIALQGVFPPRT